MIDDQSGFTKDSIESETDISCIRSGILKESEEEEVGMVTWLRCEGLMGLGKNSFEPKQGR